MLCSFILDYYRSKALYTFESSGLSPEEIIKPIYNKIEKWVDKNGDICLRHEGTMEAIIGEILPEFAKQPDLIIPKHCTYVFILNESPRILTYRNLNYFEEQDYNKCRDFNLKITMVTRLMFNRD